MIKDLWLVAILAIRSELWMTRNKITYAGAKANWYKFRQRVFQLIHDNSRRMKGYMHNTVEDLKVLNYLRVAHRKTKVITPVECFWLPPDRDELLLCCDGASRGNPGVAGAGAVARDADCRVLGAIAEVFFCCCCWVRMGCSMGV